jgi:hypothetical protein
MRKAPAKAKVETDQIRSLSCAGSWLSLMSLLKSSMVLIVMGSLPVQRACRDLMPSVLAMPFKTSLTRSVLSSGACKPLVMCNCLIPAKYELMVVCLRLRAVANQSMNVNVLEESIGSCMLTPVSFWHFNSIVSAVLYVLQVFFATPMLPHFAIDLLIFAGRFKPAKVISVQPPEDPYFVLPGNGNGVKPVDKRKIAVKLLATAIY